MKLNILALYAAQAVIVSGLTTSPQARAPSSCRCRPHEPCWPSEDKWKTLNNSIDGNLVAVKPVASICHDPQFSAEACKEARNRSSDSVWRASQPGAVQYINWEAWPEKNQSCYFDDPERSACQQGRVSLYSAVVEKAEHIQAAVCFARDHNLRLAVKNSGHCFLGRSAAPDSLQIATIKMKSIDFVRDFRPEGCYAGHSVGSAVTIGAGVALKELYIAAAKQNVSVVAGLAHTVGPAGGYIQGGGHSPLGEWKGMASDNALEFKVVTANGELVAANEYQNQDLFWALRGGGGGTFGVVVSVTVRTFPKAPAYLAQYTFDVPLKKEDEYWNLTAVLHKHLPALSDTGACGYYYSGPTLDDGAPHWVLTGLFIFTNRTDASPIRTALDSFIKEAQGILSNATYTFQHLPSVSDFFVDVLTGDDDITGNIALLGSRLISRDFLSTSTGPARVSTALRQITASANNTIGYTGHIVAGGAVANNNKIDSALNPAWRRTLLHIDFGTDWPLDATLSEQRSVQRDLTKVKVAKLRALEPDMGAYLNEADPHEEDFQRSFWGHHYERLYAVKQKLDPANLFIVRKGVGSEDWDDDGLCRV